MDENEKAEIKEKNYNVGRELGKGAFSDVYEIEDIKTHEKYALKQISRKFYDKEEYLLGCLKNEIQSLTKMKHENSVELISHFDTKLNHNLIMEICDTNLSEVLKKKKSFNELELYLIMDQFNKVFKKMRENKIIHRDLSLKNILVKYDKTIPIIGFKIKLGGYGFSKELEDYDTTSTRLGTPITIAPEVTFGQEYNWKVDLWSIGVMIYQLLFNKIPFENVKSNWELEKAKKDWIKVTLPKDSQISDICFDLIDKLMKKNPNDRIDFVDYCEHEFFSEKHKKKLIEKYAPNENQDK